MGTITQLMIEPGFRWGHHANGDLATTWNGKVDYVWLDDGTVEAARR